MSGKIAKIMVVDDDPAILFTLTEILLDAGYDVCGVKDGHQAIELASQEAYALVFMDISLPGIDGVEAYRQIKSVSPGTPVIMMTGYSVEDLMSRALEAGAYTVLYKPLDITKLLITVKDALDSQCVLVVDDEPISPQSAKLTFEDLGYQVALACNGKQAVEDAESKHYDVILMDVAMPGMEGFEACRQIVESDPSAKVFLITDYEVNEHARQALKAGAFSLLTKPVDPDVMMALIDSLVGSADDDVLDFNEKEPITS